MDESIKDGDHISELNLSVRARKACYKLGIETVSGLTAHTAASLIEVRNFGQRSLEEVRRKLAAAGLKLKDD